MGLHLPSLQLVARGLQLKNACITHKINPCYPCHL